MPLAQPDLFSEASPLDAGPLDARPLDVGPPGFRLQADFLAAEEETALIAAIADLPFKPFEFRGYLGLRQVASFGFSYDYVRRRVDAAAPLPDFLRPVRERAAAFAGLEAEQLVQVLVTEYATGAGIGWHRDKPQFGTVVGISLGAPCTLRFRKADGERWSRLSAPLPPRSIYRLSGPARWDWAHSITPQEALRYSITLRTLADGQERD